jgi:Family of unknown function (DUF5995)
MPTQRPPLPPIPTVTTLAGVVDAIDSIIEWSIATASRLGYFAALYKQITIAVGTAIEMDVFDDGPRMERFDVAFARHYFDALNGHFHPGQFRTPPRSWRVTFDVAGNPEPIILQHMLSGINAHIDLDLGIAAQTIAPRRKLPTLHKDFDRVNAVLASQVNGALDRMHELSPALADLYAVLRDHEVFLINEAVRNLRDSAWRFATVLAFEPGFARPPTIWARDHKVSHQAELIYDPPGLIGLIEKAVRDIAARESRDVVRNLQVLDRIASTPAPIQTAL